MQPVPYHFSFCKSNYTVRIWFLDVLDYIQWGSCGKKTKMTSVFYSELIKLWLKVPFIEILAFFKRVPNYISAMGTEDDVLVSLNTSRYITWLFKVLFYVLFRHSVISSYLGYLLIFLRLAFVSLRMSFSWKKYHMWTQKVTLSHCRNTLQANSIIPYKFEYVIHHTLSDSTIDPRECPRKLEFKNRKL